MNLICSIGLFQYENHLNAAYNGSNVSGLTSDRRLLIKVVKGEGLIHAKDPYCVIEMDEPAQKNQTGARQGNNPYWDEHFLLYAISTRWKLDRIMK